MAVLVTGVGYIGAKLVERLLERGEEVVALENFFSTSGGAIKRLRLRPGFKLVNGSVTNPRALRAAFAVAPISIVYALAAQASAHPDAAPTSYTERTNLLGIRLLLDQMLASDVSKIVYASSFKVYGPNLPLVVTEDAPYGQFGDLSHLSKCYAEKLMEMYAARYGFTCLPVRLGITYGVSPVMKRDYRFITAPNKFCLQAIRGEQIELNAGADAPAGFIHVADAADSLIAAAEADVDANLDAALNASFWGYTPINAATEIRSVVEVAEAVGAEAERREMPFVIRRQEGPSDEAPRERPIVRSRMQQFFDQPRRTIDDSVAEIMDYFSVVSPSGRGLG